RLARLADRRRGHAEPRALLFLLGRSRRQRLWNRSEPGEAEETRPAAGGGNVQAVFEDGQTRPGRTRQVRYRRADLQRPRGKGTEEITVVLTCVLARGVG